MIELYPEYYDRFCCIADRCEDTCCAGWEIDIDDASYEAYMRVGGDLGARLRACIKTYESGDEYDEVYEQHGFILTEDMRCPFLDDHNLCDLYRELGEESLCEVCTNTPRNYLEYYVNAPGEGEVQPVREISVSASCPEAARLIYGSPERMRFTERSIDDEIDFESDEDEIMFGTFLKKVRDEAIAILQDRKLSLSERVRRFLLHAEEVQGAINAWESDEKELPASVFPEDSLMVLPVSDGSAMTECDATDFKMRTGTNPYEHFLIRMGTYSGLASIGSSWKEKIEHLYMCFIEKDEGKALYTKTTDNLKRFLTEEKRLYEYEHLLVYYAFLLLNRCIDDYDYLGKSKLVVLSYLMNRDMDAGTFLRKGRLGKEDRQENARIYAREVEHAEENLADLAEEILFERAYDTEMLLVAL